MAKTENFKRIIVSILAIPIVLAATYFGGYYFLALVAIISLAAFYEFTLIAKNKNARANLILGSFIIFILLLNQLIKFAEIEVIIVLGSLFLLAVELFRNNGSAIMNLGSTFLGIFYIGLFSTSLIALREFYFASNETDIYGAFLIISILAAIWIGDSAAYYGGTTLGKHKLFPRVSPKKSWEGAIFGFIFSVGTLILAKVIVLTYLSWMDVIFIGVIIGIFGQVGDLVESLIKRDSEVKDSSSFIPGHGGFFDRFDSLFFSAPAIWVYLILFS